MELRGFGPDERAAVETFVAGTSDTNVPVGKGLPHAFLWTPGQGMQDLGTLGAPASTATGINDLGQVVGQAQTKKRARETTTA